MYTSPDDGRDKSTLFEPVTPIYIWSVCIWAISVIFYVVVYRTHTISFSSSRAYLHSLEPVVDPVTHITSARYLQSRKNARSGTHLTDHEINRYVHWTA